MPNIKSSKKAVKVIAKKTNNNHELKAKIKNLVKNCEKAITANEMEKANTILKDIQKNMDQALAKGLMKSNTVDRQKSRLCQKVKKMK